jgi:uncharacterized Zn finger protein
MIEFKTAGRAAATRLIARFPKSSADRRNKAIKLFLANKVKRTAPWKYEVQGTKPEPYQVNATHGSATCTCPDFIKLKEAEKAPDKHCKHLLAVWLYMSLQAEIAWPEPA